jgi:release factor glutamine methyltransferase
MTIAEGTQYTKEQLRGIYHDSEAIAVTDWLMEHLTGIRKTARSSQSKKILPPHQVAQLQQYINRLLKHEPLQYVLNESWFCGFRFYVDENVLIPRPETEELVEWIITDCRFPIAELSILDIGSGSGCIPISLKRRLGKANVTGCDKSAAALGVARRNAESLGVQVEFNELDFLSSRDRATLPSYDIIVSNPPYIPEKDRQTMPVNVKDHEPAMALFVPSEDALVFYKAISAFGKDHLQKNGKVYVEINESLGKEVITVFEEQGYQALLKQDMQGKDRMVKAWLDDDA